jgi:hypothetical protein
VVWQKDHVLESVVLVVEYQCIPSIIVLIFFSLQNLVTLFRDSLEENVIIFSDSLGEKVTSDYFVIHFSLKKNLRKIIHIIWMTFLQIFWWPLVSFWENVGIRFRLLNSGAKRVIYPNDSNVSHFMHFIHPVEYSSAKTKWFIPVWFFVVFLKVTTAILSSNDMNNHVHTVVYVLCKCCTFYNEYIYIYHVNI